MITQKLTLQYDGKIWVESDEGVGSSFFFKLKIIQQDDQIV